MKTETPRTDRVAEEAYLPPTAENPGSGFAKVVDVQFARKLELDYRRWKAMAERLANHWDDFIKLAKENGDIGFIREQETLADYRRMMAAYAEPANDQAQARGLETDNRKEI